jgi:hypothetical protein
MPLYLYLHLHNTVRNQVNVVHQRYEASGIASLLILSVLKLLQFEVCIAAVF